MEKYVIERVLRKRKFVRVTFKEKNGSNRVTVDFADKFGQYNEFKNKKKNDKEYDLNYILLYS